MPYSIRIATPDDAAAVTGLLQASFPVLMASAYEADALDAVLPFITRANPVLLSSGTYFLAQADDGQLIGCGGWTRELPGEVGTVVDGLGHIRHFGTHPDWAGQGVGRAIMETCKRTARDTGISNFECESSLNAEAFYARLGFSRMERSEVGLNDTAPIESVLMGCLI